MSAKYLPQIQNFLLSKTKVLSTQCIPSSLSIAHYSFRKNWNHICCRSSIYICTYLR